MIWKPIWFYLIDNYKEIKTIANEAEKSMRKLEQNFFSKTIKNLYLGLTRISIIKCNQKALIILM